MCACLLSCFKHVDLCAALWTIALQALLTMGFSSKNTGVGNHFLLQGIFTTQGSNPGPLHLLHLSDFFTTSTAWEACRGRWEVPICSWLYFCFIDYAKAFDCVYHNTLWKILKEMGIPDHLTCLLRKLYAGQEATVRTGHGTTDWFHIGKGVHQGCLLSPCLFNFYAEYIMRNAGLDEAQDGIKISGRNISNLRYAYDTTLMAESEEELKSVLIKVKEESEKSWLKAQHPEN